MNDPENIDDLLNGLTAEGFTRDKVQETFDKFLAALCPGATEADTSHTKTALSHTQRIFKNISGAVDQGRIYDKCTKQYVPGLSVDLTRVLGIGGQAVVVQGELDLSQADYAEIYLPIKAWELAEEAVANGEIEQVQVLSKMKRTFLPRAKRAIAGIGKRKLKSLVEEAWKTNRELRNNGKMKVAVKISLKDLDSRSARELNLAGRLKENLVYIVTSGKTNGDKGYTVMSYVTNKLDEETYHETLSREQKLQVTRDALIEIRDLSAVGGFHRDIKPANIMVSKTTGRKNGKSRLFRRPTTIVTEHVKTKVTDFGIMRIERKEDLKDIQTLYTVEGQDTVLGTIDYMSPQQARDAAMVDVLDDMYSLGCTLYKMFTGNNPNHNVPRDQNTAIMRLMNAAHRHYKPDAPKVDKYTTLVLAGLMQQDKEKGYQILDEKGKLDRKATCNAAIQDLEALLSGRKPQNVLKKIKEFGMSKKDYIRNVFDNYNPKNIAGRAVAYTAALLGSTALTASYYLQERIPACAEFWDKVINLVKSIQ